MEGTNDRRRRIERLKKMILGTIIAAIAIPVISCIILSIYAFQLNKQVHELQILLEMASAEDSAEVSGIYTTASIEESARSVGQTGQITNDSLQEDTYDKQIYLTFDDGPSVHTNQILDILKQYDIKATFFVVGKTDEASVKAYQRIVAEGHTFGMHSYSHKYDEIYSSLDSFSSDLSKLQEYLYQTTGVWPRIYRFPGGSSNVVSKVNMQDLIAYLKDNDIVYMDWNIESGDAVSGSVSKDKIVANCLGKIDGIDECVILMHDTAEKNTTVEALPEVIEKIQERGDAVFLPVTDGTVPVQHVTAK